MTEYVTKAQLDDACKIINDKIDDVKDNHLNSIEAAILWMVRDIDRLWKVLGSGIAILALVIALLKLFG